MKPVRVNWKVVAGPPLSPIQQYDLILDEYDFKMRQLEIPPSTAFKRPPQGPRKAADAFK